jgi:hypothetical protein
MTPKVIHRSFFEEFSSDGDPYIKFLLSWRREMADFEVIKWNSTTFDVQKSEWSARAFSEGEPVFISEIVRWKALFEVGGLYLDADCEITNGQRLKELIFECETSDQYDAFLGVEDLIRGAPTAQTVYSKKGSQIAKFMLELYEEKLPPFWIWRESKLLIGPDLLTLYFYENGAKENCGYFPQLLEPIIIGRVKIYPQEYFSPKFGIKGYDLRTTNNTCIYHAFTNGNVKFDRSDLRELQKNPLLMSEYISWTDQNENKRISHKKSRISILRKMRKVLWILRNFVMISRKIRSMYRSM